MTITYTHSDKDGVYESIEWPSASGYFHRGSGDRIVLHRVTAQFDRKQFGDAFLATYPFSRSDRSRNLTIPVLGPNKMTFTITRPATELSLFHHLKPFLIVAIPRFFVYGGIMMPTDFLLYLSGASLALDALSLPIKVLRSPYYYLATSVIALFGIDKIIDLVR